MAIRDYMSLIGKLIESMRLSEAEPSLAPAVKHLPTSKIYRGKVGQMHHDVAGANGFFGVGWKDNPDIQLGFINHKGQFIDRNRALEYAQTHDLLHPMAQRYIATDGTPAELGASFLKKQ